MPQHAALGARAGGRTSGTCPASQPPEPSRLGEVVWLEPLPDALVAGGVAVPLGPEARYERAESVSLAFVTALQLLPRRQTAVLILRDVLGFTAKETAAMLDATVESVTSALKRARAGLDRRRLPDPDGEPPPAPDSPSEQQLLRASSVPGRRPTSTRWWRC